MNRTEATMDDLPELPFEKVLSYLSLEDRLKARAVSRRWYLMINSFRVKSLCFSDRPIGFIHGKRRLVSGAFAQNCIVSPQFDSFFSTFAHPIFSSLKRLCLYGVRLGADDTTVFVPALNSFRQLEELNIIQSAFDASYREFELNLPILNSIQLVEVNVVGPKAFGTVQKFGEPGTVTVDSPKLRRIKLVYSDLSLNLIHAESVEELISTDELNNISGGKLKNLKYLCVRFYGFRRIDPTFLSDLEQLKAIDLKDAGLREILEQKQRYGRTDLKVYCDGLLQNGLDGPARYVDLVHLVENLSRFADVIRLYDDYAKIECVGSGSEIAALNRFTNLSKIVVESPVQDVQRFLDLLKNLENIVDLEFWLRRDKPPQDLFDRLPEHCAVESLATCSPLPDLRFLFRLEHLISLTLTRPIKVEFEFVLEIFKKLKFLSHFQFRCGGEKIIIADNRKAYPRRFFVTVDRNSWLNAPDLNAAIQFIISRKILERKKRMAEDLHE